MIASIIIPHYRDVERLDRCLHMLAPQVTPEMEVVVVDNDSGIDLSLIAARYPFATILIEPKKGAAEARNTGVAHTKADKILFIDADCVPAPDWVEKTLAALPRAAIVSGRVDTFDEGSAPRTGAQAFEAVFAFRMQHYIEQLGFSGAGNLATTRDVFNKVGPFRVGMSEDKDWSQRAIRAGFSLIYVDEMIVAHPTRSDWPALRKKWLRMTEESYGLHLADGKSRFSWVVRAVAVLLSPIPHSLKVWTSPKLNGVGERLRGTATLFRQRFVRARWMVTQSVGSSIA